MRVLDTIIAATATRVEPIAVWLVDHFGEGCEHCGAKVRRSRFAEPGACSSGRCGYCGLNYCTSVRSECPHQCPHEWAETDEQAQHIAAQRGDD